MPDGLGALSFQGRQGPTVLHYLIHYGQWPLTREDDAGTALRPPARFPPAEGRWASLALTPEEITAKRQALLAYRSQMLVIGRFMMGFGRSNELLLEGEPASLPECWCENGEDVATELPAAKYRRHPRKRRSPTAGTLDPWTCFAA